MCTDILSGKSGAKTRQWVIDYCFSLAISPKRKKTSLVPPFSVKDNRFFLKYDSKKMMAIIVILILKYKTLYTILSANISGNWKKAE